LREHPHYGHRRVALVLGISRKSTLRIMRKYALATKRRKKRYRTTKKLPPSLIPNRIKCLCPIAPNVFWAGDFTVVKFHAVTIYLATVIDLYTREIVGYALGLHHSAQLIVDALENALQNRMVLLHEELRKRAVSLAQAPYAATG
jgi:transposase InsO family protein